MINPVVLDLLVTGNGRNKSDSYVGANLRGANLAGADLKGANLTGADISEATFRRACLEWANLTLTQAVKTDFRNAEMTGVCLEAWNIESTTRLEEVNCRFVYLLENPKPGTDDRERRPSSGEFVPGEFSKLFQEVVHTVDLIFGNGVDWEAFVRAFNNVRIENEGTELAIQSIENKGDGVFVIRVSVPPDADKEKIHSDFAQSYELALKAVEEKYKVELKSLEERYQTKLESKEELIKSYRQQNMDMWLTINSLAEKQPVIFEIKATGQVMKEDKSRRFKIDQLKGDFKPIGAPIMSDNAQIGGTIAEFINQLPSSRDPNQPGIKELLTQLQEAIQKEPSLDEKLKAKALKQIKALAEAATNPTDGGMKELADNATTMLKGIIAGLQPTAALVTICKELLPVIAKFFGL